MPNLRFLLSLPIHVLSLFVFAEGVLTEHPVIHIEPSHIVDTNGAGDAFVGGKAESISQMYHNSFPETNRNHMPQQYEYIFISEALPKRIPHTCYHMVEWTSTVYWLSLCQHIPYNMCFLEYNPVAQAE